MTKEISAQSLRPMNAARPSDGLLAANATITLIELLAERRLPAEVDQLLRDLAAIAPISWSRGKNTIAKLSDYGLIRRVGATEVTTGEGIAKDWRASIAKKVATELTLSLTKSNSWPCLKYDSVTGVVQIDALMLPPLLDGLGMWITEFGVAERNSIAERHWTVASEHTHAFLAGAAYANQELPRRAKSAEKLAAELERQALHGAATEEWVIEFERRRLRLHPMREQIRRISMDDVAAGFDILSFTSSASLQHDLFIEVKSHGATKLFHWSRNEIATAREFGESYALYLVDRNRCTDPEYVPQVITGPSPEMFSSSESGWKVEATSYEHIALPDD